MSDAEHTDRAESSTVEIAIRGLALDLSFKRLPEINTLIITSENIDELHVCGSGLCSSQLALIATALDPMRLHTLHLGGNIGIKRLPAQLSVLLSLKILGIGACRIEEIPEWILDYKMLEELHARDNAIPLLPSSVAVPALISLIESFSPNPHAPKERRCMTHRPARSPALAAPAAGAAAAPPPRPPRQPPNRPPARSSRTRPGPCRRRRGLGPPPPPSLPPRMRAAAVCRGGRALGAAPPPPPSPPPP